MPRHQPYGPKILTGQALADALAASYAFLGKVWATYEGGGWIVLRGEGLAPNPDLAKLYPNGWSLLARFRSSEARARLHKMTA